MERLICVIGNKGGTGKTSITHMLCHGLGLLGWPSIAVLTDGARTPLSREGRRYVPLDGRSPEAWTASCPSWNPCPAGWG
jgi:ATPases involved in chromosome partitioning